MTNANVGVLVFASDHLAYLERQLKQMFPKMSRPARREKAKRMMARIYRELGTTGINIENWAERIVARRGLRGVLRVLRLTFAAWVKSLRRG